MVGEDKVPAEAFTKSLEVMGPLGKAWHSVNRFMQNPIDRNQVDIEELHKQLNLAVKMVARNAQQNTHQRRLNVMRVLATSQTAAEQKLKDHRSSLETADQSLLFGAEFSKNITTTTESTKAFSEHFEAEKKLKEKSKSSDKKPDKKPKSKRGKHTFGQSFRNGSRGSSYSRSSGSNHGASYYGSDDYYNRRGFNKHNNRGFKGKLVTPFAKKVTDET